MKIPLITLIIVFAATFALAEEITVFDYETNQYKFYNVEKFGNRATVFDYQTKKFYDIEPSSPAPLFKKPANQRQPFNSLDRKTGAFRAYDVQPFQNSGSKFK